MGYRAPELPSWVRDEDTEAQKGEVTCTRPPGRAVRETLALRPNGPDVFQSHSSNQEYTSESPRAIPELRPVPWPGPAAGVLVWRHGVRCGQWNYCPGDFERQPC